MFLLKKFISALVLPPTNLLMLAMLGALLWHFKKKFGAFLLWVSLALLWFVSTPYCTDILWNTLKVHAWDEANTEKPEAIVILGAGVARNAVEYGENIDTIGASSLVRLRYGIFLHKKHGLPILLTGGAPMGGEAEADVMANVMKEDYNLTPKWIENHSNDTHENALFSAKILNNEGVKRVLLVTEGFHMRRSVMEFKAAGLDVIAAPTRINYKGEYHWSLIPGAASLRSNTQLIREWLGIFALRFR